MRSTLFLLLLLLLSAFAHAQIRPRIKDPKTNSLLDKQPQAVRQDSGVKRIFAAVELAMLGGSAAELPFGTQVSLTIGGEESRLVSAAQAVSILQNYLAPRKVTQFSLTRSNENAASPYATGRMTFIHKGNKQLVQVYVSLIRQEGEWVLAQFNIY